MAEKQVKSKLFPFKGTGRDNLVTFSAGAGLNDTGEEMYAPYLPYYAPHFLDVTAEEYGLIEGIAEGVNRILRVFTGALSDRLGRKVPVVLGYILIAISRLGLPLVKGWLGFIPFRGLRQVGRALRDPAREAAIADSVPQPQRGRAFGLLNTVDTVGAIVGPLIGLLVLSWASAGYFNLRIKGDFSQPAYHWLFMLAAVPTILSSWLIWLFLIETRKKPPLEVALPEGSKVARFFRQLMSNLRLYFANKPLFRITLSHMVLALGAVPIPMILLYAYTELGAKMWQGALLFIAYNIVHFLASYPAGYMADVLGRRLSQIMGSCLCVLALIWVIVASHPLMLIVTMVLYGVFESIWITARRAIIADLAGEEARTQTLGTFSMLYGLPSLLSPILLGLLWCRISPKFAFIVMALIAVVSIILLSRAQKYVTRKG